MGKGKAPKAPDPVKTAAAQTSTNVATAIANSALGNVNQITPDGNLTFSQGGQQFVADDVGGQVYWRGPNGEIQSAAPKGPSTSVTGAPTQKTETYYEPGTGRPRTRTVTVPGKTTNSGPPEGWSQTKGYYIPTYTATQTLSPAQQAIKDQNDATALNLGTIGNEQSKRLGGLLNTPFNLNGLPKAGDPNSLTAPQYQQLLTNAGLQTGVKDAGAISNSVADAGSITRNIAGAGNITRNIANAGNITKTYGTDFSKDRTKVEQALLSRLNPQLANDRSALEQRLANQGVVAGSEAYNRAVDEASRQSNDARYGAILAGGQEQSRLVGLEADRAAFQNSAQQQQFGQNATAAGFQNSAQNQQFGQNVIAAGFQNSAQQQQFGQNLSQTELANAAQGQQFGQNLAGAQFGNDARQQNLTNQNAGRLNANALQDQQLAYRTQLLNAQNAARASSLNERFAERNQPLNEISSLLSGAQVQAPNFVSTNQPTIPTVDYAGLVNQNYANQMQAYQAKQAQSGGIFGSLLGLAGKAITLSDRRAKADIQQIGKLKDGQKLYSYRYKGDDKRQVGLMAQEVEKRKPSAVMEIGGVKHVDYRKALGNLLGAG